MQSSAIDGTAWAIILALAGVVASLASILWRGWQRQLVDKDRERNEALAEKDKVIARVEAERDHWRGEHDHWRARAQHLEDDRSQSKAEILEALKGLKNKSRSEPPRKDSPPPDTAYSMQTRTRTPR